MTECTEKVCTSLRDLRTLSQRVVKQMNSLLRACSFAFSAPQKVGTQLLDILHAIKVVLLEAFKAGQPMRSSVAQLHVTEVSIAVDLLALFQHLPAPAAPANANGQRGKKQKEVAAASVKELREGAAGVDSDKSTASGANEQMDTCCSKECDTPLTQKEKDAQEELNNYMKSIIGQVIDAVLEFEKILLIEPDNSPFREPLLRYLIKYPKSTVDYLLSDSGVTEPSAQFLLFYLLKTESTKQKFLEILINDSDLVHRLHRLCRGTLTESSASPTRCTPEDLRYVGIKLIAKILKCREDWLSGSGKAELLRTLKEIWTAESYHERIKQIHQVDFRHWNEPKLLVRCLFAQLKQNPEEIELLYQLLRCFSTKSLSRFTFLKTFLEETVCKTYSIAWRRRAFFKFVQVFCDVSVSQEVKAHILQHVVIPSFATSFERGDVDCLIGCAASPETDTAEDIISALITHCLSEMPSDASPPSAAAGPNANHITQTAANTPPSTTQLPSTVAAIQAPTLQTTATAQAVTAGQAQTISAVSSAQPPQQNQPQTVLESGAALALCAGTSAAASSSSPQTLSDSVKILLYQFVVLLIQYAAPHIHDPSKYISLILILFIFSSYILPPNFISRCSIIRILN